MGQIKSFMKLNYRHFNSAVTVDAAEAWIKLIDQGGKMFLAMAGAMSTAELGISLAEMIRKGKIHGICTTGANLEEDIYNLVAHKHYKRIPGYRSLQAQEELDLRENGFNRVTDTCIPEEEAIRRIEESLLKVWQKADTEGKSCAIISLSVIKPTSFNPSTTGTPLIPLPKIIRATSLMAVLTVT